jgi:hypothetical protein
MKNKSIPKKKLGFEFVLWQALFFDLCRVADVSLVNELSQVCTLQWQANYRLTRDESSAKTVCFSNCLILGTSEFSVSTQLSVAEGKLSPVQLKGRT